MPYPRHWQALEDWSRPRVRSSPELVEIGEQSRPNILSCLDDETLFLAEAVQTGPHNEHRVVANDMSLVKDV